MPLGWERINARTSIPNKNIAFIKPLPGRDEATSKDFLERIAAQCLPIMNTNYLSVVSLQEYEANTEFLGRNFNNGEVIQLVLKNRNGQWYPFSFVQMVMMHELAHCKEMNHSSTFHRLRVGFQDELQALVEKGYTGDGLWGKGVFLDNGAFANTEIGDRGNIPEHLCGGTFKSGGRRKRKVKPRIPYKERQERRIKKKFGTNGTALGADEATKQKLEKGKKPAGKPRVAGSARGRELRAAAALARFETKEPKPKDEDLVTDSETESEADFDFIKTEPTDAIDIDGSRLLDRDGFPLFKVCEDEACDSNNELLELQSLSGKIRDSPPPEEPAKSSLVNSQPSKANQKSKEKKNPSKPEVDQCLDKSKTDTASTQTYRPTQPLINSKRLSEPEQNSLVYGTKVMMKPLVTFPKSSCLVCSVENEATALTCLVCSNVLKPDFVHNSWRCTSSSCTNSEYINAGDAGVCGFCCARKYSESI